MPLRGISERKPSGGGGNAPWVKPYDVELLADELLQALADQDDEPYARAPGSTYNAINTSLQSDIV